MIRVHVICEGQTEEMFVKEILLKFFAQQGICLYPSLVGKPGHKGGNFKYERVLKDIRKRLLEDKTSYCTTFFDFYGLPEEFPGKQEALELADPEDKSKTVIKHFLKSLENDLGEEALRRFIPYIQLYEFEALLFSCPTSMAAETDPGLEPAFKAIKQSFVSPEHINNSVHTAPSKRIYKLYRSYDKVIYGSLISMTMGLSQIQEECALFNKWLSEIQSLSSLCKAS